MFPSILRLHANWLLARHKVTVDLITHRPFWAGTRKPTVALFLYSYASVGNRINAARVEGELSYITVLHELGHVVLGHCENYTYRNKLDCEYEAWMWAEQHALKITPKMVRFQRAVLASYHRLLDNKSRVHFILGGNSVY